MEIKPHKIFGVFYAEIKGKKVLLTENLIPDEKFFDEELIKYNGKEFRVWDPQRSKLASAIVKNSPNIGFRKGDIVLYLGSSHGYTASFVSDIVGNNGFVFAIDIAPRVMRDLIFLCYQRKNIAPILADANKVDLLKERICAVDIVYQDIAQKNQVDIFLKNIGWFLKNNGYALLALKARSIDVTKQPKHIFKEVKQQLEKNLTIIDYRELEPFQKDHCMFICKKKGIN